jgi:hypothetical protein
LSTTVRRPVPPGCAASSNFVVLRVEKQFFNGTGLDEFAAGDYGHRIGDIYAVTFTPDRRGVR